MEVQTQRQNNTILALVGVVVVLLSNLTVGGLWLWVVLWGLRREPWVYWYGLVGGVLWSGVGGYVWGLPSLFIIVGLLIFKGVEELAGEKRYAGLFAVVGMVLVGGLLMKVGVGWWGVFSTVGWYAVASWWLGLNSELRLKQTW